ncbi:MAG: 4Fe-4S dicluster domain-containing protein [Candidatus Micrarchaeia archaeon]
MIIKPLLAGVSQLVKKPITVEYPDEKEEKPDNYRGVHKLDMQTCISCGACARICPNNTIDMVDTETDKGIKKMPQIGLDRCLFCGLCEEVCPTKCLVLTKSTEYEAYDRRVLIKRPEDLE